MNPNGTRKNTKTMDFKRLDFMHPAMVPLDMESHGGDDVAVFAIGPWSHLFTGIRLHCLSVLENYQSALIVQ